MFSVRSAKSRLRIAALLMSGTFLVLPSIAVADDSYIYGFGYNMRGSVSKGGKSLGAFTFSNEYLGFAGLGKQVPVTLSFAGLQSALLQPGVTEYANDTDAEALPFAWDIVVPVLIKAGVYEGSVQVVPAITDFDTYYLDTTGQVNGQSTQIKLTNDGTSIRYTGTFVAKSDDGRYATVTLTGLLVLPTETQIGSDTYSFVLRNTDEELLGTGRGSGLVLKDVQAIGAGFGIEYDLADDGTGNGFAGNLLIPSVLTDSDVAGSVIISADTQYNMSTRTIVFGKDQLYTGGTTITAQSGLQLGNGGTAGSVLGNIENNGWLIFNRSDTIEFDGDISGTGSLTKDGSGTVILSGDNTYSGDTTILAGTLVGNTTSLSGDIVNHGNLVIDQDTDDTFAGDISGTGNLIKDGAGIVTVTGALTYTGSTTILGGQLIGTSNNISGPVITSGLLEFNQSFDGTFANSITGTGSLVKEGAGTLRLQANNSYAGGTTITDGRLAGLAGSFGAGQIVNNSELEISGAGTMGNDISGTGSFEKTGPGNLVLSGTGSFTGDTLVSGGTLSVNGSIAGDITVASGATLGGSGTVGSATVNGAIAAGNSIGTLTFNNDLVFGAGSVLRVEVRDNGTVAGTDNDLVAVNGLVTIDSTATVRVTPENGGDTGSTYKPNNVYTVLTSNGLTGQFAGVTDSFAFLDSSLSYDTNNVYLTLTRNNLYFYDVAGTANTYASARALDGFGDNDPVILEVFGLNESEANTAFNLISGEAHSSAQVLSSRTLNLFQQQALSQQQMTTPLESGSSGSTSQNFWLRPMLATGQIKSDGNAADVNWHAQGVATGFEQQTELAGGDASFGLGVGFMSSSASIPARASSLNNAGGYAGIYGGWAKDAFGLSGSLSYGAAKVDVTRGITVGNIARTAESEYWMHTAGANIEAQYAIRASDAVIVTPLASFDAMWSGHSGAVETGAGSLNAQIDATGYWQLNSGLGARVAYTMETDSRNVTLIGQAVWRHGFGDASAEQGVSLAGSGVDSSVFASEVGRDALALGGEVRWTQGANTELSLSYNGNLSENEMLHGLRAGLKMAF